MYSIRDYGDYDQMEATLSYSSYQFTLRAAQMDWMALNLLLDCQIVD